MVAHNGSSSGSRCSVVTLVVVVVAAAAAVSMVHFRCRWSRVDVPAPLGTRSLVAVGSHACG